MIATIIMAVVGLAILFLWVWAIIDVIKAESGEYTVIQGENAKIIWLIVVLLLPLIGTLIYAILEKRMFLKPGFTIKGAKADIVGE